MAVEQPEPVAREDESTGEPGIAVEFPFYDELFSHSEGSKQPTTYEVPRTPGWPLLQDAEVQKWKLKEAVVTE